MNKFNFIGVLALLSIMLNACDESRVFDKSLPLDNAVWDRNQVARFDVDIADTTAQYSIFVNVRNAGQYPYRNLYLFTQIKSPNGQYAKDTAEFILADGRGNWLGKGIGDLWEYQFPYKQNVMFPRKGTYHIELEQAMRDKELKYITDIGIRVEKVVD
jgi:gliding motility-associated lipoprotein GldH